jgi:ferredoxin
LLDDDAEKALSRTERIDVSKLGRSDLPKVIATLHAGGLRADRHNSPDLLAQLDVLAQSPSRRASHVVCGAVEADPLLPVQVKYIRRYPREFVDGLRALVRATGAEDAVVAVPTGENRRLARLLDEARRKPAVADRPADASPTDSPAEEVAQEEAEAEQRLDAGRLRLIPVRNAYPQADPSLLAYRLLGRGIPPPAHATDIARRGLILLDAVAVVGIGRCLAGGDARRHPVAVRDHRADVGVLAEAWSGTRLADVLLYLGMIHRDPDRQKNRPSGPASAGTLLAAPPTLQAATVAAPPTRSTFSRPRPPSTVIGPADTTAPLRYVAGDYLRGREVAANCLIGGGGEVCYHVEPLVPDPVPTACVRCGWCIEICPTGVNPAGLLDAEASSGRTRIRLAEQHGASACIGCGLCDHACPSLLPLRRVTVSLRDRKPEG